MKVLWQQCEGQVLDGFPLRQYLGGGEDQAVFLTELGGDPPRKAVIKLSRADPESTELHLRRWRLASALSHPNLMRLFERGTGLLNPEQLNPGQLNQVPLLYVVMEYADEDLSQVIPERPLSVEEGKEMLEPALSALAYLHSRGFVHGRLKPSNFMAIDGRLKLSSDCVSPIAPGSLTPADDVWSLGMTLVEVLTQRRPVWGPAEARDPVASERVPAEFQEIARNALRRDARSRWTISEIQRRLAGQPVSTEKRFSASAVSTILLAGALVIVAGTLLVRNREGSPLAPGAAAPQAISAQPPVAAPVVTPPASQPSPLPKPRGEVVRQVLPDVDPQARNSIRGKVTVNVRVEVDSSGEVRNAALETPGLSQYFSDRALKAAQRWKFAPADQPRVWILRFEFTRAGTKAAAVKSR